MRLANFVVNDSPECTDAGLPKCITHYCSCSNEKDGALLQRQLPSIERVRSMVNVEGLRAGIGQIFMLNYARGHFEF